MNAWVAMIHPGRGRRGAEPAGPPGGSRGVAGGGRALL